MRQPEMHRLQQQFDNDSIINSIRVRIQSIHELETPVRYDAFGMIYADNLEAEISHLRFVESMRINTKYFLLKR